MKIIERGECGGSHKYAIIDVLFNGTEKSFNEIKDLIEDWDDEPARMTIEVDPHHIQKVNPFIEQLDLIDDFARDKGIEARIAFTCLCSECRRISVDVITKTVRWRSRWERT